MINTTLLGFAVLAMRSKPSEVSESWKPSAKDAKELEENMKSFATKIVNGRKQYPFELYLESKDIISFDQFGRWQVKNPVMYDRVNRTESLREWIANQEQEKLFNAFPEEREAHRARLDEITKNIRV